MRRHVLPQVTMLVAFLLSPGAHAQDCAPWLRFLNPLPSLVDHTPQPVAPISSREAVRRQVLSLLKDKTQTREAKISGIAEIYFEERIAELPPAAQPAARTVLWRASGGRRESLARNDSLEIAYSPAEFPLAYAVDLAHEFEHYLQQLQSPGSLERGSAWHPLPFPKTTILKLREERGAFRGEWDLMQLFPRKWIADEENALRDERKIKRGSEHDSFDYTAESLANARLSQATYVRKIAKHAGYHYLSLLPFDPGLKLLFYSGAKILFDLYW